MPVLNMNCVVCNKLYRGGIFPSRTTKFCSSICFGVSLKNVPRERKCETCSKIFYVKLLKSKGKYCNPKCIRGIRSMAEYSKCRIGTGFWDTATEDQKWERIKKHFDRLVIKNDKCWAWKNALDAKGYGRIHIGSKSGSLLAHRVSWIIHNGNISDELWVLHKCDNPPCTNPDHLYLGTPKDNSQDCVKRSRKNVPFGLRHYNIKLNEQKVIEIKKLIKLKYSQSILGKMFNVSPSTIQNIADGKTWKHV